jgi:tRNA modification GTPase
MWANDTIAAVSTPAGASAEAIVRLSGPDAFAIVERLVEKPSGALAHPSSYSAREAALRLGATGPRCPVTLYLMPGPMSYTREDVAEMHVIGSPPVVRVLLDACLEQGARLAEPGEFTRRAFLAGRITLAQAEGVLAAIQAESAGELRAAMRVLDGEPSRHIRELHDQLVALRAQVEASIDFAQHDVELVHQDELLAAIGRGLEAVDRELANADTGALPPEGVRVALCGLPNAGKSSLFNALVGRGRAIVTEVPGTTRDAVAEPLVLGGVRFRLYDTAGLFDALPADAERRAGGLDFGVPGLDALGPAQDVDADAAARARGLIAGTQIALVVLDASRPLGEAERRLWEDVEAPEKLLLLSKADLPSAIPDEEAAALAGDAPVFRTSAETGQGVQDVAGALVGAVRTGQVDASPADLVWNARHRQAFRQAREALRRARRAAEEDLGAEFVAADLREAHDAIGAVTGDVVAEDILDAIFAEFCIGK